jgi:hypothetical protein
MAGNSTLHLYRSDANDIFLQLIKVPVPRGSHGADKGRWGRR